jgi:hypothetical protein
VLVRRSEPAEPGAVAEPRREVPRVSAVQPQAARAGLAASGVVVPPLEGRVAGWDAAAEPRQVAVSDAAVLRPEEAAAEQGVAGVQPREEAAERDVAVLPQVAAQGAVAAGRRPGAVPVSEVLRRAARDEPQEVLPSAAALAAAHPCLRALQLAPSPLVRSARARADLRIAQP